MYQYHQIFKNDICCIRKQTVIHFILNLVRRRTGSTRHRIENENNPKESPYSVNKVTEHPKDFVIFIIDAAGRACTPRSTPRRTGGLQPAPAGMFAGIFVLVSTREYFLANFIMRAGIIACIRKGC